MISDEVLKSSGKMLLLHRMLPALVNRGHKVYQFELPSSLGIHLPVHNLRPHFIWLRYVALYCHTLVLYLHCTHAQDVVCCIMYILII